MLGHIYYIIGIIPLLASLSILLRVRYHNNIGYWATKFKEVVGKTPSKGDYRTIDEYNNTTGLVILTIIDLVWVSLGLLTNSWYMFIISIIFTSILSLIRNKLNIRLISLLISIIILISKILLYLYLIINHFHLHYDTWSMIINNIK